MGGIRRRRDRGTTSVKQILQSLKEGTAILVDVPVPALGRRHVPVSTSNILMSTGV